MRIVRLHHIRPYAFESARESPRGRQVHLGACCERNQVIVLLHASIQLAIRMRDENRALTQGAEAGHGVEDLALPASPCARRVDVKGNHQPKEEGDRRKEEECALPPFSFLLPPVSLLKLPQLGEFE